MADIRCPNCGENNPDFLDVCQFCQTPLKPEAMVHTGDSPTKKDTGELEPILPDWLKEARQQNREAAEEEAATKPKIEKVESPDLLAGLASQAESQEEDVPDWLAGLNPVKEEPSSTSAPAEEAPSDFFSQFRQKESEQPEPSSSEPVETPSQQRDELSDWFSQVSSEPGEPMTAEPEAPQDELGWPSLTEEPKPSTQEAPEEKEPEDLSWLHNLEAAANQADETSSFNEEKVFASEESSAQSSSQEDLSWLNNLGGIEPASSEVPTAAPPESSQDDMSWLNNLGGSEQAASFEESPTQPESQQDDLSWLDKLGGTEQTPAEESTPAQAESAQEDMSWLNNLGGPEQPASFEEKPTQSESQQEDLSWLDTLGGTEQTPAEETTSAQPESSQADLSWLNNLGESEQAPSFEESSTESQASDELSWLDKLGETEEQLSSDETASSQRPSQHDDMDWLNNLGQAEEQAFFEEPAPTQPVDELDNTDWLKNLGQTEKQAFFEEPAPTQPVDELDNTDWLKNLEAQSEPPTAEESASPYSPPHTAPLSKEAAESIPDWLKSATEEPSMPPPGGATLDWFEEHDKTAQEQPTPVPSEMFDQTQAEPASVESTFEAPSSESESVSSQDVDSMFSVDMPDWLTREPENAEEHPPSSEQVSEDDTLSPVELPSWVQAMRPVESVIEESSAGSADQITEKEGPLAGFRGVIPFGPIGSSRRPKAVSLKLQVTDEQQASAALLEQIINSETTALPIKSSPFVASQRTLRWMLAGLFWLVLGVMIFLGTRSMPIVPPASVNELTNLVSTIPDNSPVLVVVDYEPSLAGELEPASGPLLDQLALTRHSTFTFLSMSPNGSALVERLLNDTNISKPQAGGGLGYQAGEQYFNLGYLPGGSAGVLGFVENPKMIMPTVPVNTLSDFAAVVVLTDHPESGRVWIEQLEQAKQQDPILASKPLLMVSSAQAGPLLQPYVSSGQVDGMVSGLSDAAKYEFVNNSRPGIARAYWDAFGVGLMMAVIAIVLGSLWSLFTGMRARRATTEQG